MEEMQVKVFWFYHPEDTASGFTGKLPYPVRDKPIKIQKKLFMHILAILICDEKFN